MAIGFIYSNKALFAITNIEYGCNPDAEGASDRALNIVSILP